MDDMDRSIKVGLVGLGWWAEQHANSILKSKLLKLYACHTRDPSKGQAFARRYGCTYHQKYEELLRDPELDALIITTPHTTHLELATKAAEAGKHVLIEKPMALTVEDCRKMIDAFKQNNLVLAVGHDKRWAGNHRKIRELVQAGVLGDIIFAEGNYSHNVGLRLTPDKWRWYRRESPGGSLSYTGIHIIDTLRFLTGQEIVEVDGLLDKLATPAEIYDTALARFKFSAKTYGWVTSLFTVPRVFFVNLYGTKASVYARENDDLYIQYIDSEERKIVPYMRNDPILSEQEDFAKSIFEKRKPEVDGREGMINVAVIEAIIKSSAEKRIVALREVLSE